MKQALLGMQLWACCTTPEHYRLVLNVVFNQSNIIQANAAPRKFWRIHCTLTIFMEVNYTVICLLQDNIAVDEADRFNYQAVCKLRRAFHFTNMKKYLRQKSAAQL